MPFSTPTNTDPTLSLRDYFGSRILHRLALRPGTRVLEACSRSRAVRLPPVTDVEWHVADPSELPADHAGFDAVVCGFGIHQADDMTAATRRLWQLVRPRGQLLIATWSGQHFEPANGVFWETVRHVRPSLREPCNPWNAIDTVERLVDMLRAAGVPAGQVWEEPYDHPLPDDWWAIVMDSHYRAVVDQLAPHERDAVRLLTVRHVTERQIESIDAGALFAIARK